MMDPDGCRLQRLASDVDVAHVLIGEHRHEHPAVRLAAQEPLLHQPLQRLPDRTAADAEAGRSSTSLSCEPGFSEPSTMLARKRSVTIEANVARGMAMADVASGFTGLLTSRSLLAGSGGPAQLTGHYFTTSRAL